MIDSLLARNRLGDFAIPSDRTDYPNPATSGERFSMERAHRSEHEIGFDEAVRAGLGSDPKWLPCRFLYDEMGSELFEQICSVAEYYPTRCEREILEQHAGEIAAAVPSAATIVELGSGSAVKTKLLLEAFLATRPSLDFVPIDISPSALEQSGEELTAAFPALRVRAIESEYEAGLERLASWPREGPRLIVWLGSSIGNLSRAEAGSFLATVSRRMQPADRLLVGIDLRKDRSTLEQAYDDAAGVTARFNLNLLERINRELDGHFDLSRFAHEAVYVEGAGRVEMRIVSQTAQKVAIDALGMQLSFAEGERIHTENAHKYSPAEIDELAQRSHLALDRRWLDSGGRFSLSLLATRPA